MDRYLFQNKNQDTKVPVFSRVWLTSETVLIEFLASNNYPGQRLEHQIIDDSLNHDCIAFELTVTRQLIFTDITEV